MELIIADKEKSRKEIGVSLSAEEVNGFFDDALKNAAPGAKVPGFRKGRAPAHILELRLGRHLRADVLESAFKEAFRKARDDEKLEPASYPEIDAGGSLPERGRDFSFKILLDVLPEVVLGEYRGIKIERENVEVPAAVVEDAFKREQEAFADLVSVEGRPAQKGDRVSVEGVRTVEGGAEQPVPETVAPLGSGGLPPELEDGLAGAGIGEEREIPVKMEDGKTCVYRLKIKDIREKRRIISNDDSAKAAGFSGEEEWKEDIRKRIRARVEQKVNRELRFKAADLVVEGASVDIPESMLASREEYFRQVYEVMGRETGKPADEAAIRDLAAKQAKENLVINKISRVENIEASRAEASERRKELLSRAGADSVPDEDEIRYSMTREKVIDFILENAVISDAGKPLILRPDQVNLVSER